MAVVPSSSHSGSPSGAAGGDLTGTYPDPTLAAAGGGAAGPTGSALVSPIVTVDAKGRVTALSSATILTSRRRARLTAQGLLEESGDRGSRTTAGTMVDGTIYFVLVGLLAGDTISNISIQVNVAAVAVTVSKVGLYSPDGTRRALSADQGAAWQTQGLKTAAMIAPYVVTASGGFYVAAICKAGTPPDLTSGTVSAASNPIDVAVGAGSLFVGVQVVQTDLIAAATIVAGGAGAAFAMPFWAGLS